MTAEIAVSIVFIGCFQVLIGGSKTTTLLGDQGAVPCSATFCFNMPWSNSRV